ncbi:TniQ family protein [Brevibacillus invocatus]|uniref:TniQ family protein n=1 Tax=Brevibacillus invocatus TaxID=173959 RepID=UPI0039EE854D
MFKEDFDIWRLPEVILPERSRLHSLPPMNLGTEDVESLSSYLMRLSESHSVNINALVEHAIIPIVNSRYKTKFKQAYSFFGSQRNTHAKINSKSVSSERLIEILRELTRQDSLHSLVFSLYDGVTRGTRAWCPQCINEWIRTNKTIYEPLLWYFSLVKICPIHKVPLQQSCPSCNKQLKTLHSMARINYCYHCKSMLNMNVAENSLLSSEELKVQRWICRNLRTLIKYINDPRENVENWTRRNLLTVWKDVNKSSLKDTGKMFLMRETEFLRYCNGDRNIPFHKLVWICYVLRVSLKDFMYKPFEPANYIRTIDLTKKKMFGIVGTSTKTTYCQVQMKLIHEEKCKSILYRVRWPNGIQCAKCGYRKHYTLRPRNAVVFYACGNCKNSMSLTTGTFMKSTGTPINVWFLGIMLVCSNEQTPHKKLTEAGNIHPGTATNILKKIRAAVIDNDPLVEKINEEVKILYNNTTK